MSSLVSPIIFHDELALLAPELVVNHTLRLNTIITTPSSSSYSCDHNLEGLFSCPGVEDHDDGQSYVEIGCGSQGAIFAKANRRMLAFKKEHAEKNWPKQHMHTTNLAHECRVHREVVAAFARYGPRCNTLVKVPRIHDILPSAAAVHVDRSCFPEEHRHPQENIMVMDRILPLTREICHALGECMEPEEDDDEEEIEVAGDEAVTLLVNTYMSLHGMDEDEEGEGEGDGRRPNLQALAAAAAAEHVVEQHPPPQHEQQEQTGSDLEVMHRHQCWLRSCPKSRDCLVQIYLGAPRRRGTTITHNPRPYTCRTAAAADNDERVEAGLLRDLPMDLPSMRRFGLDYEELAIEMGQAFAIMHWGTGVDGRNVKFVLGTSVVSDTRGISKGEWQARKVELWLLDFGDCSMLDLQGDGIKVQDVYLAFWGAMVAGENELSIPHEHEKVFGVFKEAYLRVANMIIEEKSSSSSRKLSGKFDAKEFLRGFEEYRDL